MVHYVVEWYIKPLRLYRYVFTHAKTDVHMKSSMKWFSVPKEMPVLARHEDPNPYENDPREPSPAEKYKMHQEKMAELDRKRALRDERIQKNRSKFEVIKDPIEVVLDEYERVLMRLRLYDLMASD